MMVANYLIIIARNKYYFTEIFYGELRTKLKS